MNADKMNLDVYSTYSDVFDIDYDDFYLLSTEQELSFLNQAQIGDLEALNRIFKSGYRFVICVAYQYVDLGLPLKDLIYDGSLGLIKAVDKFKFDSNISFMNYAIWHIRASIVSSIDEYNKVVNVASLDNKLYNKVSSTINYFAQHNEKEPVLKEILTYGKLTSDEVYLLLKLYFNRTCKNDVAYIYDDDCTFVGEYMKKVLFKNNINFKKQDFLLYIHNTLGKVFSKNELEDIWVLYDFKIINDFNSFYKNKL